MKKVCALIAFCFVVHGINAQSQTEILRAFTASDSTGYWLVVTKNATTFPMFPGIVILRRLSSDSYIVKGKLPATDRHIEKIFPASSNWKLSPRLLQKQASESNNLSHKFHLISNHLADLKNNWLHQQTAIRILYEIANTVLVQTSNQIIRTILPDDRIDFIDIADEAAREEVSISGFDYTLNRVNAMQQLYPQYDGKNTTVSVKENRPDTADIDFKGRYIAAAGTATTLSSHATIMSTIIAGAGNSFYTGKGVAPAATISSSPFDILLPDSNAYYKRYNISVQNHSYGTGIENFYGADARAYDASVNSNPALLHVFSSGNAGDQASTSGAFTGISGYANLTGSFKMAKNIIAVGSADSLGAVPLLSSKGPAYDGRIKPDLIAYGEDGSSGAAALVSGTALVLQDIYKKQHADSLPDAALVKTILLNTASSPGINFGSGYGNLDALRAATAMHNRSFFSGTVAAGQAANFDLPVPANAKNLKIMLGWMDPPAAANAFTALVNDLDLTVTHQSSQQQWLPWVLNSFPNKDSLQQLPVRKRDSLNNQEQVTIDDPSAGVYNISVQANQLVTTTQKFFIAFQWDTVNTLRWTYPTANDNLLPGKQQVMRWNNQYNGNGQLEFTYAGSNNWQTIARATSLSTQWIKWTPPDTNAVAILRMTINGRAYLSDSFTISAPLQPVVGYNCPDEALLYWNKAGYNRYAAYKLGDRYMETFKTVADSFLLVNKQTESAHWFSIAPVLSFNKTGIHSIAFDYSTQGVDCYFKNFTADLINESGKLSLSFGSLYQVKNIIIEKMGRDGVFQSWKALPATFSLQYTFNDSSLLRGANMYRLRLDLQNGTVLYSEVQTIYFTGHEAYLLYPNPVRRAQTITVLSSQLNNPVIQLFNAYGQKLVEKKLFNLNEQLATAALSKGVYFYVILENGKKTTTGKLIVQ